jgi:hypothetical protein
MIDYRQSIISTKYFILSSIFLSTTETSRCNTEEGQNKKKGLATINRSEPNM